jgi:chromate transporter
MNSEGNKNTYGKVIDLINEDNENQSFLLKEDSLLKFKDIAKMSLYLGAKSIGGPREHVKLIRDEIVEKNGNMNALTFQNILEVCRLLPGYSSSNFLAAICTVNTKSIKGGIIALLCYNFPAIISLLIVTTLFNIIKYNLRPKVTNYNPDAQYFNLHDEAFLFSLMALAAGIVQASLALLLSNSYDISKKLSNTCFQVTLILFAGALYYFKSSYYLIVTTMVICGFLTILKGDHDYLFGTHDEKTDNIPYTGFLCLFIYFILFIVVYILNCIFSNRYTILAESSLRMGAISLGEGHVIVPIMLGEYKDSMEEAEVINGYAIVSLLPGSLLNISTYAGVVISNIIGGLISGIAIFIPGFLFILTALPIIKSIKMSANLQHFIRGANSAAIGFIFSCAIKLWIDSCFVNKYTHAIAGTLNVIFCVFLSQNFNIHKTNVLIIGAVLNLTAEIIHYLTTSKSMKMRLF